MLLSIMRHLGFYIGRGDAKISFSDRMMFRMWNMNIGIRSRPNMWTKKAYDDFCLEFIELHSDGKIHCYCITVKGFEGERGPI